MADVISQLVTALSTGQTRPYLVNRLTKVLGMDGWSDSTTLSDGVVQLSQNMRLIKGIAYTREGYVLYNSVVIPNSSGLQGLGSYLYNTSTPFILAVTGGVLWSGVGGTMTSVLSGLNLYNLCSIVQFQDVALIIDQASGILVYQYGQTPFFLGTTTPAIYKLLSSFEVSEGWTVSNGTQTPDIGWSTNGMQSITFQSGSGATMTTSYALPSTLNLTTFSDGSTSSANDLICISFLRGDPTTFSHCYLQLGDAGMSNYFSFDLTTLSQWSTNVQDYVAFEFAVPKSSFSSTGSPSWNSIVKVQVVVMAVSGKVAVMTLDFYRLAKAGPTATDSGQAGLLNGSNYYYETTFVDIYGNESEASLPSNEVAVTNHSVNVTYIPVSGSSTIVRRNIYRIGGTSSNWTLVYVLQDNVTTSFVDNISDTVAEAGGVLNSVSGNPYTPSAICIHGGFVVIANLTSPDGINYPDGVMVSTEDSYAIYDVLNFFEVEPNSGTRALWLHSEFGKVYIGKEDSIWSFDPSQLNIPPVTESRLYGGVSVNGVVSGENCFYYYDRTAIVRCDGTTHTDISTPFVRNYLQGVPVSWLGNVWMEYYDHTLYVGIPQQLTNNIVEDVNSDLLQDVSGDQIITQSTTFDATILVYYVPTGAWFTFFGWNVSCSLTASELSFGEHLYLGDAGSGSIYDALLGDTDSGATIDSVVWLRDSDYGEPETLKDFDKLYLIGAAMTATPTTLTITPYLDFQAGTPIIVTLTSQVHTLMEIPIPPFGWYGTYLSIKIESSQRWMLRSLIQVVRMKEPTY